MNMQRVHGLCPQVQPTTESSTWTREYEHVSNKVAGRSAVLNQVGTTVTLAAVLDPLCRSRSRRKKTRSTVGLCKAASCISKYMIKDTRGKLEGAMIRNTP